MQLKQKRFALANEIRFTQDTLLQKMQVIDTVTLKERLGRFEIEKKALLQESLLLADSIKIGLDSLMQQVLVSAEDRKAFDIDLKNELRKLGCTDKSPGYGPKK